MHLTHQFEHEHLQIPRKPAWDRTMTPEDVDRREKNAFLAWRREIAVLENNEMNVILESFLILLRKHIGLTTNPNIIHDSI
jgi:hypothetical protein